MFERVLKFFIENYKINYALFFLIFSLGIYSYTLIPKEISPAIEPESVTIRGSYSGASVDILNKMAVQEIQDEVKNIDGVQSVSSIITPGRFSITLELDSGANKDSVTDDVKDALTLTRQYLPSDMDLPTVRGVGHARSIMQISLQSATVPRDELRRLAKIYKSELMGIDDVSDVTIFGDSDLFYEVLIDEKMVRAYNLSLDDITQTLTELSYVFPLGKIEDSKKQYYLSTSNGKKTADALEKTIINIKNQQILLGDIAIIKKRYGDSSTLASMNAKNSISLAISQNPKGDAISIAEDINKFIKKVDIPDIELSIRMDQSTVIKDRLNIVISNIMLGIILIALLTAVLINARMAFIIVLGIPTSFVMGAIYFYLTGYSININSLIGVLIAIGIIVDDAIVVAENIQQYIERGYSNKEAAFLGAKEMAKPVTLASLTTLFSFIPLLMLSGRLGEIMQYVPIAFGALVLASLIESFVFLPIHAVHTLKSDSRTLSWQRVNKLYVKILKFFIAYQKSFLLVFIILVPLLIFSGIKHSRFQMFQSFDATSISITYKAQPTTTLEESLAITQKIEEDILKQRDRFFVKNVSATAGYRRSATGSTELYPYVGYINVELYEQKPQNFLDKYITPYLSFYYNSEGRIRDISSQMISQDMRKWLKEQDYKSLYHLSNLMVVEKRMGHVKADINIGVVSDDYQKAITAVREIEAHLDTIEGIKYSGDNIKMGTDEIKLRINSFGERLGVTEKALGHYISNLYLSKKSGVISDNKELLDIKIESMDKDNFSNFKNLEFPLKDGTYVKLQDICDFETIHSLERLVKDDGETNFYVFANVEPSVKTSSEAIDELLPTLEKLKKEGIKLNIKGEQEQTQTLQYEMLLASVVAIVLIFISILYLFNSLRETLLVMSVIPFSFLGVFIGHFIMGLNLSLPSLIGTLGLAGVIVNDGIIMMATIKHAQTREEMFIFAARRFRPIVLTSVTTIIGLSSLIFFATAEAVTFQPLAVTIGFGLLWGTILNLFYLPTMYHFVSNKRYTNNKKEA
jgi:multidrug efflux pump subunit AcrB